MISKENYTKLFRDTLYGMLKGCDTEDKIKSYVQGIDYKDEYEFYKEVLQDEKTLEPIAHINKVVGGYYYMVYPEY